MNARIEKDKNKLVQKNVQIGWSQSHFTRNRFAYMPNGKIAARIFNLPNSFPNFA